MPTEKSPARYRHAVIPHATVDGAADAIAFYAEVLGANELVRIAQPDGRILHAEIQIGDSVLMLGDAEAPFGDPRTLGASTVGLHVYVDDVDSLFAAAVSAGVEVLQPPQDMFYGDRTAMFRDPFGHVWVLLTHIEDLTLSEIKARGEELLAQSTSSPSAPPITTSRGD